MIVTERVLRRDVMEIVEFAREVGTNVIGPNPPGIICPHSEKIGMAGGPSTDVKKAYSPGTVEIISRSGGMTTETANLLTNQGIGLSTCISVGGDPAVGSDFLTLISLFENDPETRVVVIFCEPGGAGEERLTDYAHEYRPRLPIIASVAGQFADEMLGVRFGHAGAIVEGDKGST